MMMKLIDIANGSYYLTHPNEILKQKLYDAGSQDNYLKAKPNKNALVDRALLLSSENEHSFDYSKWELAGMSYSKKAISCACGHPNINNLCHVRHKVTGNIMVVGGSCLKKYFFQEHDDYLMAHIKNNAQGKPNRWLKVRYDLLIYWAIGFADARRYIDAREDRLELYDKVLSSSTRHSLRTYLDIHKSILKRIENAMGDFKVSKCEGYRERGEELYEYLCEQHQLREDEKKEQERLERFKLSHQKRRRESIDAITKKYSKLIKSDDISSPTPISKVNFGLNIPIDPCTGFSDRNIQHKPLTLEGTRYMIDVADGRWYCKCEELGYMRAYPEAENSKQAFLKCVKCKNEFHFERPEDLF